jgi:hypothetical protein
LRGTGGHVLFKVDNAWSGRLLYGCSTNFQLLAWCEQLAVLPTAVLSKKNSKMLLFKKLG